MSEPSVFVPGGDSSPAVEDLPKQARAARSSDPAPSLKADDVSNAGALLASQMEALGYHPVILFGMAASGKTSLLSSLLAVPRTEAELETSVTPGAPILDQKTEYGKFLASSAEQFFGSTVQNFIAGRAPNATKLQLPFFVPVEFQPKGKQSVKFAFMESAGEWYRPDEASDRFFPVLRKEIEDFVRHFPNGISFIHLAPYTQAPVRTLSANRATDPKDLNTASLALAGALSAYQIVRANKERDHHIMLVTKWDAQEVQDMSLAEALLETADSVEPFVAKHYEQAYTTFRSLSLRADQVHLANYCSGLISGSDNTTLRVDHEHRAAVLSFPKELWRWLYGNAAVEAGGIRQDPFPVQEKPRNPIAEAFWKIADRLIG